MIERKFIKYFCVGSIGQLTDYLITLLLFSIFFNIFYSNLVGYIVGSISTYIGHTKFTFRKSSRRLSSKLQILFFFIGCVNGVIIGYLILKLLVMIKLNIYFAKIIQLIFIAFTQYLFNTKITFNLKN